MNRVSAPIMPPSQSTSSRLTTSKYSSNLARSWPPGASLNSLDHGLQVHLHTRSITASKGISKLDQLRPPSAQDHGHQVHVLTCPITASECIAKLVKVRPPSVSANTLNHGLEVHLQSDSITASEYISQFTRSWYAETVELAGRPPVINIPPHLAGHPTEILEKERLWLEERRKRVKWYDEIPGHDDSHKLRRSMNPWQECGRNHRNWVDLWKLGKISPSPLSPHLRMPPLFLYLCMPPTGFPLSYWMAVVVRNRFSRHQGLQVHPYVLSIGISRCSSNSAWVPSAGRLTVCIYIESLI